MARKKTRKLERHRPNAGMVVFNRDGKVLLCRRCGSSNARSWQFPQGGIDAGEKPLAAAKRELHEETGIPPDKVKKIGKIKGWLAYDFPDDVRHAPTKRQRWDGQKQRWFAFRFLGEDKDINLEAHQPPEFDRWEWVDLNKAPQKVVAWKRHVYEQVVKAFSRFAIKP